MSELPDYDFSSLPSLAEIISNAMLLAISSLAGYVIAASSGAADELELYGEICGFGRDQRSRRGELPADGVTPQCFAPEFLDMVRTGMYEPQLAIRSCEFVHETIEVVIERVGAEVRGWRLKPGLDTAALGGLPGYVYGEPIIVEVVETEKAP